MQLSPIDEIKSRLDIAEVIGSYIKLTKAGRNFKALCPFHSEKTPSFMVSVERQIWHCFGCGLGGDIFAFVKQIEGVEFGDALRTLAQRAGVILKKQDPQIQTKRKRLYEICELAAKFFEKQLESKNGQEVYKYLNKERGLKPSTIKQWRLGWAPDQWRGLSEFLKNRGYKDDEIIQTGLVIKPESDKAEARSQEPNASYDRFRSRIMFPIFDISGRIVGFAGRIFGKEDEKTGKYINTPQTFLYDKSRLLYGLNFTKFELRQKNSCVLVEGNLDVIMSHQAGVKNAVASSGTALTPEHLKIIKRYTDNLLFAFDADQAGETATKRSIDLAMENEFNVKIIKIGKKDPADLIKQEPAKWQKAIDGTVSIMDYYFETAFAKYPPKPGPEDKKQIGKTLLPMIKKIANQIEKAHWIGELAKRLKVEEKILYSEMQKTQLHTMPQSEASVQANGKEKTRTEELEERILSLCLNYPENLKDFHDQPKDLFFSQGLAEIMEKLKLTSKGLSKKESYLTTLQKDLSPDLCSQIDYLLLKAEQWPLEENQINEEIMGCFKELRIIRIKEKMMKLGSEIQESQTKKEKEKLLKIMEKFKKLSNQLIELTK